MLTRQNKNMFILRAAGVDWVMAETLAQNAEMLIANGDMALANMFDSLEEAIYADDQTVQNTIRSAILGVFTQAE